MRKLLLLILTTVLSWATAQAYNEIRPYNAETGEKGLYKPSLWQYNSSTGEYTYDGVSYSVARSRESENFVVYWSSEYGTTAPDALATSDFYYVDIDYMLQKAEEFYTLYSEKLGFVDPAKSTTMSKYKCMICLIHTQTWMAYGSGYDYVIPALWINPSTCKPIGHTVAHEIGHAFHYMCFSEANNHTDSYTVNTGFHLQNGTGQSIWEQTAQWQAAIAYPSEMFNQSYPLFGNNANMAFSHENMRYQSYWFHYYLSEYYDDITMVGQVWNQPMTGQSNGTASDFLMAYMALKGLTAEQLFERYHDYALHCATYDFKAAKSYRSAYIGKFDYHAVQLDEEKYQVSYSSVPQCSGFNVIELSAPGTGKSITTRLTGLKPGCELAKGDPAVYNNGNANTLVAAGVKKYNSVSNASARGFRVGYAFYKSDGTTEYYNDGIVHCQGTDIKTEEITATVPSGTSRVFLVITPSLTSYICHRWDGNIKNDDQWPYQFELVGTTAKSVTPDIAEPEFEKVIDGREISNVTLTYNVILPPTSGHDAATVNFSGSDMNALCTAFQMSEDDLFGKILAYSSNQQKGTIMNYAATANEKLQTVAKTTNGDFGHWFNSSGTAMYYGNGCVAFAEFTKSTKSANVGQYPNANVNGTKRTIREALKYINAEGKEAVAYLVFNITFKTGSTAYSYLTSIDYVEPGTRAIETKVENMTHVMDASVTVKPGDIATYTLSSDDIDAFKTALKIFDISVLSTTFKGYYYPMTSIEETGVYYYALDAEPVFDEGEGTTSGTAMYYNVPSVTNDADFEGQNTYYYDGSGVITNNADASKITVAFDKSKRVYSVKVSDDCPEGTYTMWYGMFRHSSLKNYFAYFPVGVKVESTPDAIKEVREGKRSLQGRGYDLNGRFLGTKVSASDLKRGVYILDGRKILVE